MQMPSRDVFTHLLNQGVTHPGTLRPAPNDPAAAATGTQSAQQLTQL